MKHDRKSVRFKGDDYGFGAYFVTICCRKKEHLLGEITGGILMGSEVSPLVDRCWHEIPEHFPQVELDAFVIMPNHIHGILHLHDADLAVQNLNEYEPNKFEFVQRGNLGIIIGRFKGAVTKTARENGHEWFSWQRSYFDVIIRDQPQLHAIRNYIRQNPQTWPLDDLKKTREPA